MVTFKITPTQPFIVFSTVFKQHISYVVRWRFVIHAGIDGYSKRLVYINCSTDNRADTVLQLFKKAVDYHGLSSRVCGDRGVENVEVARYNILFLVHLTYTKGTNFCFFRTDFLLKFVKIRK